MKLLKMSDMKLLNNIDERLQHRKMNESELLKFTTIKNPTINEKDIHPKLLKECRFAKINTNEYDREKVICQLKCANFRLSNELKVYIDELILRDLKNRKV